MNHQMFGRLVAKQTFMTNYSSKKSDRDRFRIIAGEWRGRKLSFPGDIPSLRPTTDRIRETLFNWLQLDIAGASCLDLFSGSGALAFEACSRGADTVTAIDSSTKVTDMLMANCKVLECSNMHVITADGMQWLQAQKEPAPFDIIFLDPPYALGLLPECLSMITNKGLLKSRGLIYLESDVSLDSIDIPKELSLLRSGKAGQVFYGVCGS